MCLLSWCAPVTGVVFWEKKDTINAPTEDLNQY